MEQEDGCLEIELTELDKRTEEDLVRTIVELVNVSGSFPESQNYLNIRLRRGDMQEEFYRYFPGTHGVCKQIAGKYKLIGWLKFAESFDGNEKYSAESSHIQLPRKPS